MDLGLMDKVAVVGGGSNGLGRAVAERLLHEGANVTIFARRAETVAVAEAELAGRFGAGRILGLAADCAVADDLDRVTAATVDRFGPAIHVLVTNDGGPPIARIDELTDEIWSQALQRHFFYVVRAVRSTLPHLAIEGGSILNVVSGIVERPAIGMAASVAVWSAVIGYAKTLALELASRDITVNTMLAGLFDTSLVERALDRQPELSKTSLGADVPMGRLGDPHEFGDLAAALVSPNLKFATGLAVPIDGGSGIGSGGHLKTPRRR